MRYGLAVLFGLLLINTPAMAAFQEGLTVKPFIVQVHGKQRTARIFVKNTANRTAYLHIDLYQYHNAGLKNQRLTRVKDMRRSNLIVTPSRFILPAGKQRVLRLRILKTNIAKDQLYSVDVREAAVKPKPPEHMTKAEASIQVLIGFDVLVIHHRPNGKPVVSAVRHGNKVTFKNTGNTTARIVGQKLCHKKKCVESIGTMITPGQVRTIKIPLAVPGKYNVEWSAHQYTISTK